MIYYAQLIKNYAQLVITHAQSFIVYDFIFILFIRYSNLPVNGIFVPHL